VEHWSHHFLLKELICLSNSLQEEPRWKFLFSYNEGVYITKGESLNTLMNVLLPMNFQLTWLFTFHAFPLDFHFTIHFEYNTWSTVVTWHMTTHDMTWHDTTDMDCLMMWKCQATIAAKCWMSSWRCFSFHLCKAWWWGIFNDLKSWIVVTN